MKQSAFAELLADVIQRQEREVREAGQREYAHDPDNAFSNFERLASELGLTREKVLWVYLKKHLDGILAWINGHRSQREDVTGRVKDARMYLALLWGMAETEPPTGARPSPGSERTALGMTATEAKDYVGRRMRASETSWERGAARDAAARNSVPTRLRTPLDSPVVVRVAATAVEETFSHAGIYRVSKIVSGLEPGGPVTDLGCRPLYVFRDETGRFYGPNVNADEDGVWASAWLTLDGARDARDHYSRSLDGGTIL